MIVRKYQPADRAQVEAICAASGLRGQLDALFCDREIFTQLWLAPFLDGEPEHTWVAEVDGAVRGYLVAGIRPGFHLRAVRRMVPHIARMLGRWIRGRYRHHPATSRFIRWFLTRSWREVPPHPAGLSNFHFNLDPRARGELRLGDHLMRAYFDHIRSLGHDAFYIHVFASSWQRPLNFYRKNAFRIHATCLSSLFEEPTVVATLVREIPEAVNWMQFRVRELREISLIVPEASPIWDGQALRHREVVVGEAADREQAEALTKFDLLVVWRDAVPTVLNARWLAEVLRALEEDPHPSLVADSGRYEAWRRGDRTAPRVTADQSRL
ncbi:MAG: hypothetical protein SFX74_02500 [Fimbriimonadaceae bacterium]|nr:hypothetical protein [Fimbriimonadaceae bacterium]